uniref:Uncharacterized protein n=1 Tax=Rhizophagus irregularis (strain DAOM 181602 / DAOM 197198 / MUCL 43194) TaxID=747089 RepID=U9UC11_RHIID
MGYPMLTEERPNDLKKWFTGHVKPFLEENMNDSGYDEYDTKKNPRTNCQCKSNMVMCWYIFWNILVTDSNFHDAFGNSSCLSNPNYIPEGHPMCMLILMK